MIVYLGGPINGCTDDEAHGWREQVKPILEAAGHEWLDPMDRDYRGQEMEPGIVAEIVIRDKKDIDGCDVLLMHVPRPSYGTAMEIMYGWERYKRVIVVHSEGSIPSPWVIYHASEIHHGSILSVAATL